MNETIDRFYDDPAYWIVRPPRRKVAEAKDSSGHEHKGSGPGGGQFTGQGGGAGSEVHPKVQGWARRVLSTAGRLPAHLAGKVKATFQKKFAQMETRYGRKAAFAVISGVALMTPVPLPGTSLLPIALAEGIRGLSKLFGSKKPVLAEGKEAMLNLDELVAAAKAFLAELAAAVGEKPPELDEDELRQTLAAGQDSES
jgi:hypothetical protein